MAADTGVVVEAIGDETVYLQPPKPPVNRLEQYLSLAFDLAIGGMIMPSSQLKRAERAIQTIRDQAELPPETADALQEIVDVIRAIEGRCRRWKGRDTCPLRGDGTAKSEMTIDYYVVACCSGRDCTRPCEHLRGAH